MQNKVILIDIDHTLFDTDKYLREAFEHIAMLFSDKTKEEVISAAKEVYARMREVDVFHPYRFSQRLKDALQEDIDVEKIVHFFEDSSFLATCVYDDVHPTLEHLSQQGLRLGIFSTGEKKLQMEKIDVIGHFFKEEDIHVYPLKDIEIPQVLTQYKGEHVYIIDDILRVLEEVQRQDKKVTKIWITRKESDDHPTEIDHFSPDRHIHSLSEVIGIVA